MGIVRKIQGAFGGGAIPQTICWGTLSQAELLIPWQNKNTRRWAHRWVRRHFSELPLGALDIVDAGSGTSNRLLDWYRPRVRHAYLLDFLVEPHEEGNSSFVRADLEKGMPVPDACADVVTSVSSVEHLSEAGQMLFLSEAARVLRPGGRVIATFSYVFALDAQSLKILSSNPVLAGNGFAISARPNLRRMLERAPELAPPVAPVWKNFPGFEGFAESAILADRDILLDPIFSGDPGAKEVNALGKRYGEIGIYLVKK
ncbi:MAG: class I SAM-dependent methyltransferase [Candidatus Acidiferrales bacterium]